MVEYIDNSTNNQAIYQEALRLGALGYRVHPVHGIDSDGCCTCGRGAACASPGKHPVLVGFLEQASTDPNIISSWPWGQGYNLGIVPGDKLIVLDFDGEAGRDMLNQLMEWCPVLQSKDYGLLLTGSGGVHLIGGGKAKSYVRRLPGMDVRGVGGQAVVPPSRHYSGNVYRPLIPLTKMVAPFPPEVVDLVNGGTIPSVLEPADIVTADDLKAFSKKQTKYQTSIKAIVKGEPFAVLGERDVVLTGICGTFVKKWPQLNPKQVAKLFGDSLASMQNQPGAPTPESVEKKLARFKLIEQENRLKIPQIFIGPDIIDMARQGMAALSQSKTGALYRRAGFLVHVVYDRELPALSAREENAPSIRNASISTIRGELGIAARWIKRNQQGDLVPKMPPLEACGYIIDEGTWPVSYLEGVTSGPFIRPDGSVCRGDCYDETTGLLSIGARENWGFVPLKEALEEITSVFVDFPFRKGHYSALLAALLTGAGRHAFSGPSPLFLIDANTRGAGKTLAANAVAKICARSGATGAALGRDIEEDRKQITALAIGGAQIVLIDNVEGRFGTAKLCEALTLYNGTWADRVLGKNHTWRGPLRPLWLATGNNVRLTADMVRRTCYCRLETPYENPELRKGFKNPSLLGYVDENRRRLHWCVVSILKHYWDAGRPLDAAIEAWGGYEGWSDLIRGAVLWCGYDDPKATWDTAVQSEEHVYGRIIIEGLGALLREQGVKSLGCSKIIAAVYGIGLTEAEVEQYQDLREVFEGGQGRVPTPQSLGKVFQHYRDRVFNGKVLKSCGRTGREWRVVEVAG